MESATQEFASNKTGRNEILSLTEIPLVSEHQPESRQIIGSNPRPGNSELPAEHFLITDNQLSWLFQWQIY